MTYNYDALYGETPDALGEPTPFIVDYFKSLDRSNLTILDVGCDQGRDAQFLAEMGHRVHGIDLSPNGIDDLENLARSKGLSITGEVADILTYQPTKGFDIVLIDRTLHMLDQNDRHAALSRLPRGVGSHGKIFIADETSNINGLTNVLEQDSDDWQIGNRKGGYLIAERA